jgi:hypothetical protein
MSTFLFVKLVLFFSPKLNIFPMVHNKEPVLCETSSSHGGNYDLYSFHVVIRCSAQHTGNLCYEGISSCSSKVEGTANTLTCK